MHVNDAFAKVAGSSAQLEWLLEQNAGTAHGLAQYCVETGLNFAMEFTLDPVYCWGSALARLTEHMRESIDQKTTLVTCQVPGRPCSYTTPMVEPRGNGVSLHVPLHWLISATQIDDPGGRGLAFARLMRAGVWVEYYSRPGEQEALADLGPAAVNVELALAMKPPALVRRRAESLYCTLMMEARRPYPQAAA